MRAQAPIAALLAMLIALPARGAKESEACATASEEAQLDRIKGRWTAARAKLAVCGAATCPAVIRDDCTKWLAELDKSMPTVVVSAREQDGGDVVDARLRIDGVAVSEKLDGTPIAIDPGAHVFRL